MLFYETQVHLGAGEIKTQCGDETVTCDPDGRGSCIRYSISFSLLMLPLRLLIESGDDEIEGFHVGPWFGQRRASNKSLKFVHILKLSEDQMTAITIGWLCDVGKWEKDEKETGLAANGTGLVSQDTSGLDNRKYSWGRF